MLSACTHSNRRIRAGAMGCSTHKTSGLNKSHRLKQNGLVRLQIPPRLNLAPVGNNLKVWICQQPTWLTLSKTPALNPTNLQNEVFLQPPAINGFLPAGYSSKEVRLASLTMLKPRRPCSLSDIFRWFLCRCRNWRRGWRWACPVCNARGVCQPFQLEDSPRPCARVDRLPKVVGELDEPA
jgi:hypothetical protein